MLDESYFQIIAEWEHYAVLTLFDCYGFDADAANISDRLNISRTRAEVVLDGLHRKLNLFHNRWLNLRNNIKTTAEINTISVSPGGMNDRKIKPI